MKKPVTFRLDQAMIDKVEKRIERDGITLSTLMRRALRAELELDPSLSMPVLKAIALKSADEGEQRAFFEKLLKAIEPGIRRAFKGDRNAPAIKGAPLSFGPTNWTLLIDMTLMTPADRVEGPFVSVE